MTERRALDIDALLDDPATRIVVCCGSGGVGKTTTAAALGVRAAERGRRVVVLTIDPARRLAQSLGITELDNDPRRIEIAGAAGTLDAMMLDMKRTFDEVVAAHADEGRAEAIFANPFYQALSSSFAGTQEYMAMEKLSQLRTRAEQDGGWDLIVVDTPPSRSALDFLDAPRRLGRFLDGRLVRTFAAPARAGGRAYMRVLNAGVGVFTGVLDRVIGGALLADIQTFVASLDSMFGGFRERAEDTYRVLKDEGTAFLVVAAPEPDALREATYFVERLGDEGMPLAGLILNRMAIARAPWLSTEQSSVAAASTDDRFVRDLLQCHVEELALATHDRHLRDRFAAAHPQVLMAEVPAQPTDVHDLAGLREVGAALAGKPAAAGSAGTKRSG